MSSKMMTYDEIVADTNYEFVLDGWAYAEDGSDIVSGHWIVDGEHQQVRYGLCDLYRDAGGEYPCEPCEGGIMVFELEAERRDWLNQRLLEA